MNRAVRLAAAVVLGFAVVTGVRGADTYKIDPMHTHIGFSVAHMVINEVEGKFKEFEGTIVVNPDAKNALVSINGTIQATSIDTGVEKRDNHLRSADFFDVAKFPTITFESKKAAHKGPRDIVGGTFTMHGVAKDIVIPVTVKGPIKDPMGNTRIGLKATITVNRKDYGLTWNKALEAGGLMVGEDVEIEINAEAVKEVPAAK